MSSPAKVGPGAPEGEGSAIVKKEDETQNPAERISPEAEPRVGPGAPEGEGAKAKPASA